MYAVVVDVVPGASVAAGPHVDGALAVPAVGDGLGHGGQQQGPRSLLPQTVIGRTYFTTSFALAQAPCRVIGSQALPQEAEKTKFSSVW